MRILAPSVLCVVLSLAACTGYINTPGNVSPVTNGSEFNCPVIDPMLGRCQDLHVLRAALTCGGDGKVAAALSTNSGGGTRARVQFKAGVSSRER